MPASATPSRSTDPVRFATADSRGIWLVLGLIALGVLAAYANSLRGPFVFDDIPSITDNPSIRQLWPLSVPLSPPSEFGLTVCNRPLLNLSLALNYALGGCDPFGYHVLNALIHLAAAATAFGLVRRTVPHWRPATSPRHATLFAGTVTALWALHPLLTESVTYVIQRGESLMGLFAFLTLYAFVRAADSARPLRWRALAVLAAFGAAASKEVGVIVPVLALLYDGTFLADSWRTVWRERRFFHLALLSSWLLLAWILFHGGARGGTAHLGPDERWAYWVTQIDAVTHYLRLAFWPRPLVFEYGYQYVPGLLAVLPQALLVGALGAATLVAIWRRHPAGFLGCWFFVGLAPASLTPNTIQVIVEHRMYLPLLAPLALVVGFVFARSGVRWLAPFAFLALVGAGLTFARNRDYSTEIGLWTDTVAKAPRSARAWSGLGGAWMVAGRYESARDCLLRSVEIDSTHPGPHLNLGLVTGLLGRDAEAAEHFALAARLNPNLAPAFHHLAICLVRLDRFAEAAAPLQRAMELDPQNPNMFALLGVLLAQRDLLDQAAAAFRRALELDPQSDLAEENWGTVLLQHGRPQEALPHLERAYARKSRQPDLTAKLASALLATDQLAAALDRFREAAALAPERADLRTNFGIELARARHLPEARAMLAAAIALDPRSARAHTNLGNVLTEQGEFEAARVQYEEALRLEPGNAFSHFNLANVLLYLERFAEARTHLATTVRLDPSLTRAQEVLRQMEEVFGPAE